VRFQRRLSIAGWLSVLLAVLTLSRLPGMAQTKGAIETAKPPVTAQQGAPQPAYTLPPDKLAKAIQLDRIRNVLEIIDSIWGIVLLWLLLVSRAAAGMEKFAQRLTGRRWVQGGVFFVALVTITILAGLPLRIIGHHFSLAYGISGSTIRRRHWRWR